MKQKIILGPPGTGKTHRLMELLDTELKTCKPEQIAYVSFTREGAYNGRDRAIEQFKFSKSQFPYFKTLHSIAFAEMDYSIGNVMNKKHYAAFGKAIGMDFSGFISGDMRSEDDKYLFYIDTHKNNSRTANRYLQDLNILKLKYVNSNLNRFKSQHNLVTYTDMIQEFCKRNTSLPVKVAFIDEAQDLTTLQWEMILIAFRDCKTIYIAGDDDQAIYQWSGADVKYFLNLNGEVEFLRQSYRLPSRILTFSQKIAKQINERVSKDIYPKDEYGSLRYVNELKHVKEDVITFRNESWLFLARNRFHLSSIKEFFDFAGIPYMSKNKYSVTERDIHAINAYEKIRKGKDYTDKEYALARAYVPQGCKFSAPWYDEMIEMSLMKRNYYRNVISNKFDISKRNIRVDTIHAVKGAEADNVVLLTDITRAVHDNMKHYPDSELRVFYVGCTRAKRRLFIVYPQGKYYYDFIGMGM